MSEEKNLNTKEEEVAAVVTETKKAVTKYINLSKVLKDEDVIIINNIQVRHFD